ncbi:Cellulose synthase (UDP-forming) [Handroanthus impetiginosus]|uniref:Cellulose synthase (UDP-forming) n=1 Tax=Handroanthus impetiginosus TaxID=429701 RepID=A0A2G9GZF6_9LAMI|nr:Cellulose synthase (UDP-forming) [Handroanthus impetiginosus]
METSLPLNDSHVRKTQLVINRLHAFLHGIALLCLFYYRITSLSEIIKTRDNTNIPLLPHVLIFISELILSFIWLLGQPYKWKPVVRTVYPERLPGNEKLPPIDVFICTADPNKEPCLEVMNTVISALALDYPSDKLHVYLSDDGGSSVTFRAMKQAWKFSKLWIPFCRKYGIKNRCPEAYFLTEESASSTTEFVADKKEIKERYEEFKNSVERIAADISTSVSRNHPPLIEVVSDANGSRMDTDHEETPILVYVAREKRPSHPHHFKAGALNVLLRVSAMISNSPYMLVLDCGMYCNDATSACQAMYFHLDSKLSPKLGFVQFPQKFYNISETDIYDGQLRYIWQRWEGLDGLRGPILSGTGFYIKREALYGTQKFHKDVDHIKLRNLFGSSNEFIKSIYRNYKLNFTEDRKFYDKELRSLASCSYDTDTKWGKEACEVGFRYFSLVEDFFTGFNLHCEGWKSVYIEPSRPCFLGASPTSLSELLVQHARWNVGLNQVSLSKFSPLVYGPLRMSTSQSMCYAEFAYSPLYFLSLYVLAIVPQLCLLRGIPLYPEVSSPFFHVFSFVFLSAQLKNVQEVSWTGHSIRTYWREQRIWMIKSLTSYLYATLDAVMEKIGLRKASFLPKNKVVDNEQTKRYQMGIYDFQASALFMVPLCSLYILNVASFVMGFLKILHTQKAHEMLIQVFIPLFAAVLHFPLLEGMVLRKDKGRVPPSVSLLSALISVIILSSTSPVHHY